MNHIIEKLSHLSFIDFIEDKDATIYKNTVNINANLNQSLQANGFDYENGVKNLHHSEVQQTISKKIFQDIGAIGMATKVDDIDLDSIFNKKVREDKLKELFGEEIIQTPLYQNISTMQRLLFSSICKKIIKLNANMIVTNGAMGAALQDVSGFESTFSGGGIQINMSMHQYLIGSINGCPVFVDAYMRYNDNRIIVGNVDYEVRHNDTIEFNEDLSEMTFGYDQKINPNSKVEVLNVIDTNMFLI